MSLQHVTPEPRRRAAPKKPATKKAAPRRTTAKAKAPARPQATSTVDAARLFRRFEQQLAAGDHVFSQLAEAFGEWCEAGDMAPPASNQLAAWLKAAGLTQSRRGRKKITTYTKRAARLAA